MNKLSMNKLSMNKVEFDFSAYKMYFLLFYFVTAGLLMTAYFTKPFIQLIYTDTAKVTIKVKKSEFGSTFIINQILKRLDNPSISSDQDNVIFDLDIDFQVNANVGLSEVCVDVNIMQIIQKTFCYDEVNLGKMSSDVDQYLDQEIQKIGKKSIDEIRSDFVKILDISRLDQERIDDFLAKFDSLGFDDKLKSIKVNINLKDDATSKLVKKINKGLGIATISIFSLLLVIGLLGLFGLKAKYKITYEILTWLILLLLIAITVGICVVVIKRDLITTDEKISLGFGISTYIFFAATVLYTILKILPFQTISKIISKKGKS